MRLEDVAARVGVVPSTLSRIETGQAPTKLQYLAVMIDLYCVDDQAQREHLADLACDGQSMNWWANCSHLLPAGAGKYLDLEAAASCAQCYSIHAIPGLLQTRKYASACLRTARPELTVDQVHKLGTRQLRRQELARNRRCRLHLIIDESALLRSVGARVMADQLRHLAAVGADAALILQVAELASAVPVLSPSFAVLSFSDPTDPDFACGLGIGGQAVTTRRRADVQAAHATFAILANSAASPEHSMTLIENTAAHWERQASHDN